MKMQFVRSWRAYRAGQVVDVPGGLAAELKARKIAIETRQASLLETAAIEPVVETADATPRRRKRGVQQPDTDNPAGRRAGDARRG